MSDTPVHDSAVTARHARYGIILFIIYVVLYAVFVALAAFRADLMGSAPFGGVNLAVLYGMGLIVAAFVLAVIYMLLCRPVAGQSNTDSKGGAA